MTKTAIVLFNLGGPDSQESIRPYLKNFFMDKNIIRAPWPVRVVVSSMIAARRSKKQAGESYALLGGKSPLLENTQAQADALEKTLNAQAQAGEVYKTFISMRYWHPMTPEAQRAVQDWNPDRVVLLPLYPQYSTTTSFSALEQWRIACGKANWSCPETVLCCYPRNEGFVEASAQLISETYMAFAEIAGVRPRLLFSAHGLPEKIVAAGDPYQWQCEESAKAIAQATGIENLDWSICYQSRVGPLKWIGPSTEEALHRAAEDGVPVIIYPHAFVSEHVETLVEIEMEYRHLAEALGVPGFARVPTVSTSPVFIDGLARMVLDHAGRDGLVTPQDPCPERFGDCCVHKEKRLLAGKAA